MAQTTVTIELLEVAKHLSHFLELREKGLIGESYLQALCVAVEQLVGPDFYKRACYFAAPDALML